MKFYGEPKLLVKTRNTGVLRRIKQFRFDTDGVFETDNIHLIKVLKTKFKHDEDVSEEALEVEVIEETEVKELTDEEIRKMAKESGIKSWHVKSIETLKEEMGV